MPLPWSLALVAVLVVAVAARLLVPGLPRRGAVTLAGGELALVAVGLLGLVGHCSAMFAESTVRAVPGTGPYVGAVNGLGATSALLYAVPALLIVVGLRRAAFPYLSIVVLVLVAVGVTMYDHGPLTVHLSAILTAGVALAVVGSTQVRRARSGTADPA